MKISAMQKGNFEVYRAPDGEFRAFFRVEDPRRVRTVLLPVSTRRAAGFLAARLWAEFAKTGRVRRTVPEVFRRRRLPQFLYEYVGHVRYGQNRQWKTALGYRRLLEGLFRDCRWQFFADVTAEGFAAWREKSDRGPLHADRVLRAAKAFFDSLTIAGAVPENPLRAVAPRAVRTTTEGSDARQAPTTNA